MRASPWVAASLAVGLALTPATGNAALVTVEPDLFASGTDIRSAVEGVTLAVATQPGVAVVSLLGTSAFLAGTNIASTGQMVFARDPAGDCNLASWTVQDTARTWQDTTACGMLKATFAAPTDYVAIDVIFDDDDTGTLRAYDANGQLLQQVNATGDWKHDKYAALAINRASQDIAYVLAGGITGEGMFLDNLRFQNYYVPPSTPAPEPATLALISVGLIGLGYTRRRKQAH